MRRTIQQNRTVYYTDSVSGDWAKIEELFHRAAAMPAADRAAFLDEACVDAKLRQEVDGLLAADDSGDGWSLPLASPLERLAPGSMLGAYRIEEYCGEGATGTVYRAHDTRTGAEVAIKVFPRLLSPQQRRRFLKEAQAASVVQHPAVVRVHEAGSAGNCDFLVMEYVAGRTLAEVIPPDGLPLAEALALARQILEGLTAAHQAGIVHRDLKPSNVMVTDAGAIRILDFGLAKVVRPVTEPEAGSSAQQDTQPLSMKTVTGQILGTVCYLSPEQAEGQAVDVRTDVFSFGVLLYEMLAGEKPFDRGSLAGSLSAILRDTPPSVRKLRPGTPRDVARLVDRCLEKNREKRYYFAGEVLSALTSCEARIQSLPYRTAALLCKPRVLAPAIALLLALAAGGAYLGVRWLRLRKIRTAIEPEIVRLVEQHRYNAADLLVLSIANAVPNDAAVREFQRDNYFITSVITDPPGAEVAMTDYDTPDGPWRDLGRSPLEKITVPMGYFRWRVSAAGYRTRVFAETAVLQPRIRFRLYRDGEAPPEMVLAPAGNVTVNRQDTAVPEFWVDRYEVTNRQYREFVKAGGYQKREFWAEPFSRDGHALTWEQAMEAFHDQTNQRAPAGWEAESYPEGKDDYPVTGVSWYEAAAMPAGPARGCPRMLSGCARRSPSRSTPIRSSPPTSPGRAWRR